MRYEHSSADNRKEREKEFVVLPYEEFVRLQEDLEDYEDLKTLRDEKAVAEHEPTRKLDDILKEIQN
jgi:hypothetical protein